MGDERMEGGVGGAWEPSKRHEETSFEFFLQGTKWSLLLHRDCDLQPSNPNFNSTLIDNVSSLFESTLG